MASIMVKLLKFNKIIKAKKHNIKEYITATFIEILPDATGLFFVRNTFESKSLSKISLTMHPADLINIAPQKKRIQYLK